MADVIDIACDCEQLDRDLALASARRSEPQLPAVGQCYNCLERLPDGVRFCDCDCRNDYANRKHCEALRGQS